MSPLTSTPAPTAAPAQSGKNPIIDVGLPNFVTDVIEESRHRLVIVDFWAPWCNPCKQLGPALEALVIAQKGAVRLAKVNIDEHPQIAQQMRVQSIPAVFAFFQGQPVDGFMGAVPDSQLKSWLERLIKATGGTQAAQEIDAILAQAEDYLAMGEAAQAQELFGEVLREAPTNAPAFAGVLRCLIALGDTATAQDILAKAPPDVAKHKALDPVRATLELAAQTQGASGQTAELRTKVEAHPDDHAARFDLAMAYYGAGEREQAVDELLEIVRRDRTWNEEAARKQLVKFFEAFGPMDPLTIAARKRLSSVLFS